MEEMKEIKTVKTDDNEALTISLNTVNVCCKGKKFLDNLATSWRNILNDSSASDIIVFVKNNRHIWTHKLVFYTRCTNILLDVITNDTEFSTAKEKICWLDTDYDVALAFLEFIYCGIIDKYSKIFDSETSLSNVRALGRKYKINDLFVYLRQKEFKSNVAEIKHDYNICEKSTGNIHPDIETALNVSKLDTTLIKLSEEINSRSNTPAKWETSGSPDMFDDTPVMKHSDKSTVHPKDLEDSNIHILLSLIKQDADVDIYSQKLLAAKTQNAEFSELDEDIPTCSKNVKQNVMESDIDPESNSPKFFINNMHQDSLIDTPQSNKSKYTQNRLSEVVKQKSDLTLFIEKIQKENAKLDAALNSDMECSVQISPIKHKNPFHIDKYDNSDLQSYDNVEQSADTEERPGRLTIIEQRMRSYADKNPEFYSRLSNERENVEQTNNSHVDPLSPKKIMESSHNNISNCTQNFTSPNVKRVNISERDATVSAVYSQDTKTMNQSQSETIFDLETNEEEISMYTKYMRHHKDNSIAKYRTAISRNMSDSNLSNKSTSSDSINEDGNISETEKDENLTQSVLTQKDADVIVSSDTDVESISSNVSHVVLENDDSNHEIISYSQQQSRKEIEGNKQDIENENSSQLLEVEKFSKEMTSDSEEEKDINSAINLSRDKLNSTEITSLTQNSRLNELNDQKRESIPSPIMLSSSPDFLDDENCSPIRNMERLFQDEHCTENVSGTSACKLRKSAEFSLNFEDDIYLGNVDTNKYEKHILEKSQSFNTLNMIKFKNGSLRRCNNKNNHENIKDNDIAADDYGNLNSNAVSLTQNFTSIRKFQRKSLSEGQIDTNRLYNQGATSTYVSTQFQCNYIQNIENAKTPKITDKDVTPPPEYNDMNTPELHVSSLINLYN